MDRKTKQRKLDKVYWIQNAIKNPGALKKYFNLKEEETFSLNFLKDKLSALKKQGKEKSLLAKRISFAIILKGLEKEK